MHIQTYIRAQYLEHRRPTNVFALLPLFTDFSVFSTEDHPSWLAYISPRASRHNRYHTVPTTHQSPSDTVPPTLPIPSRPSFPLLGKPFCLDPSSSASPRPESTYPEACFLIPKHRTRGSSTPANTTCGLCLSGHW